MLCDKGYETYKNEIQVSNANCAATGEATLMGCIAEAPETSIFNDGTGGAGGVNRHLCKTGDYHCRQKHGWCKDMGGAIEPNLPSATAQIIKDMNGYCYPCPPIEADCDNQDNCIKECFRDKPDNAPDDVIFYKRSDCDTNDECQEGEFCYSKKCQICSVVAPLGEIATCDKHDFFTEDDKSNCRNACQKESPEIPKPPETVHEGYLRFSRVEREVEAHNGETYGGYCVGQEFTRTGQSKSRKELCEDGSDGQEFWSIHKYQYELDSQCATRECTHDGGHAVYDPTTGAVLEWTPSYCMVKAINSHKPCIYDLEVQIDGNDQILHLAGKCVNGECLPREAPNFDPICPDGYVPIRGDDGKIDYHSFANINDACEAKRETAEIFQPKNRNRCGKTEGNKDDGWTCRPLPKANKASATMYSHSYNNWPLDDGTTGTINTRWEYEVSKSLDEYFWFMMFTDEPIYPAVMTPPDGKTIPEATLSDIQITAGVDDTIDYKGRALVCDPDMTDIYKEDYGCIIDSFGEFYYQGSNITFYGFSNETTKIRHFQAEPLVVKTMPMVLCGSVATRSCLGSVTFNWVKSESVGELCNESFAKCKLGTHSPTTEPTRRATSHGDPIIWTFHDECYDLNKDGLYDATVNPKFNHVVKLGVYNEFMRELQVVSTNGEVLLSINSLGEYEKSDNFLYRFKYEEKECPVGMKDTECVGTYKEWMFDAQEFEYTVHLLRHDYKDNGIPEGDLGYHLDIYPRPYKSFRKPGHLDSYSGLFFENPLPEELEYCVGGSTRNENIKLEQSKPKDATVFA